MFLDLYKAQFVGGKKRKPVPRGIKSEVSWKPKLVNSLNVLPNERGLPDKYFFDCDPTAHEERGPSFGPAV